MQHFWLQSIRLLVVPPKHFLPVEAEDDEFPMRTKHTISFFQFSRWKQKKPLTTTMRRAGPIEKNIIIYWIPYWVPSISKKMDENFHNGTSWKVMNFCNPNLLKETTFSLPLDASSSLVAGRHILHRNFIKLQWLASIFHLAWNDLNKVSFH